MAFQDRPQEARTEASLHAPKSGIDNRCPASSRGPLAAYPAGRESARRAALIRVDSGFTAQALWELALGTMERG